MAMEHLTQITTAWALAHEFGHAWACELTVSEVAYIADYVDGGLRDVAASIAEAYYAIGEKMDPDFRQLHEMGIPCPEVVGDSIVHTTGGGGLTWSVGPHGEVTLTISTPRGVVAQADVAAPEMVYGPKGPYIRREMDMWMRRGRPRHITDLFYRAIRVLANDPGWSVDRDALAIMRWLEQDSSFEGFDVRPILVTWEQDQPSLCLDSPPTGGIRATIELNPAAFPGDKNICGSIFLPATAPVTLRQVVWAMAQQANVDPNWGRVVEALADGNGLQWVKDYIAIRSCEPVSES